MSTAISDLKEFIQKIGSGRSLSETESEIVINHVISGEASAVQVAGLLMGMRVRGETADELTGAARAMRAHANMISAPSNAIDTCGTGGDGVGTYNISTAVSLVVAACGVPVAKHGNKAVSSKSGAADVLSALGVNLDITLEQSEKLLNDIGFSFLLAPNHHPAMRHVAPIRAELGSRTLFNLMGPLLNPAGVKNQLVGVFSKDYLEPMARVLQRLGSESAWVVHGSDGLDEITTTGVTYVCELKDGNIRHFEISPDDVGLFPAQISDIQGGDADDNAEALTALLKGEKGPYRDIVLLNSAAALTIAGQAQDIEDGMDWARRAIDNGAALSILERLIAATNIDADT